MAERRMFRTGMLDALASFYPARCTLQNVTRTRDDYGQPVETWADDDDLVDLRGLLVPATEDKLRQYGLLIEQTSHILALAGHYPGITPDMRVVVATTTSDGTTSETYTVRGVRHDAHGLQTHLGLTLTVASAGDL